MRISLKSMLGACVLAVAVLIGTPSEASADCVSGWQHTLREVYWFSPTEFISTYQAICPSHYWLFFAPGMTVWIASQGGYENITPEELEAVTWDWLYNGPWMNE